MKKILLIGSFSLLLFSACTKTTNETNENLNASQTTTLKTRRCGTDEAMQRAIAKDPSLKLKMNAIEKFVQENLKNAANEKSLFLKLNIPVVVNVLYKTDAENVTLQQIQSQIDVLNEDFNAKNVEYNQVPALFGNIKTSIGISFSLARVVRRYANKTGWTDESMKFKNIGGINASSPTKALNIWVVNKILDGEDEILGYAYYPGTVDATYDGLVIGYRYFGRMGTALPPFHKGRTATHEIGHWMNLVHIWGDKLCGSDLVSDTPQHDAPNFGCTAYPHLSKCNGAPVEMTMNYMDYSDDACMGIFTRGQKNRARVIFNDGGPRAGFFN